MGRFGSLLKRFVVAAAYTLVTLAALWLPLLACVHFDGTREWKIAASNWVSGEEIRHLMKYHGTAVLKITKDRVYILRESRWIPVRKRAGS